MILRPVSTKARWGVLTSLFLAASGALPVFAADCAPPAPAPKKSGPACLICPKTRLSHRMSPDEYQELVEAVAAALAEAEAAQAAPAAAAAPANFAAPAPTGQVAGASHSVGIRGLEIHFPELRFALPTLQLPSLVKFRREPHMQLDPASAPMVAPAAVAPAPSGYFPQYAAAPALAPAGAPATAPAVAPASTAPARTANAGSSCRTRVRRVAPSRARFWSNEDEWEVIQEGAREDCAPDADVRLGGPTAAATSAGVPTPGRTTAGRSPQGYPGGGRPVGLPKAPAADAGGPMGEDVNNPIDLPPEPGGTPSARHLQDELDSARAELNAARRQLAQVTQLLSDTDLGGSPTTAATPSTAAIEPTAATPPRRMGNKAEAIQRLFQELEAPVTPPGARAEGSTDENADEPTSSSAATRTSRSKSPVQPAGHVTGTAPSTNRKTSAGPRPQPTVPGKSPAKSRSWGPGHGLERTGSIKPGGPQVQ